MYRTEYVDHDGVRKWFWAQSRIDVLIGLGKLGQQRDEVVTQIIEIPPMRSRADIAEVFNKYVTTPQEVNNG